MAAKKVDVSELLLQLKELKQKKACHMKKLKRKLGRAVTLKQLNTKEETINTDSGKSSSSKVGNSDYRNALTELNYSETISSSSRLLGNELKSQIEKGPSTANQQNCNSHCEALNIESSIQVIPLSLQLPNVQFLSTEESISKVPDSLKQTLTSQSINSLKEDANSFKNKSLRQCHKRSAVESEIDETSVNIYCLKKKTKVSCKEISYNSESDENHDLSLNKIAYKHIGLDKSIESPTEKFGTDLENKYINSENTCDISSSQTSKEVNEVLDSSLLCKISCPEEIVKQNEKIKIDSNSCLQEAHKASEASFKFICEKELDPNITEVADTEQLIESHYEEDKVYSLFNLEPNISKIAETEQLEEVHSQSAVNQVDNLLNLNLELQKIPAKEETFPENKRENSNAILNSQVTHPCDVKNLENECSEISLVHGTSRKEQHVMEEFSAKAHVSIEKFHDAPLDVASFEEIKTEDHYTETTNLDEEYEDFPTGIASFEEVTTENVQLGVGECSPAKQLHSHINCSFTDDEGNDSKLFDSEDLTGLFMRDSQLGDDSFEQMINPHSSQINEGVLSSPSKKDEKISSLDERSDTCQDVYSKCQEHHEDDFTVGSEIFTVPETELFDFVSHNQNKVDKIAQNISVTSGDLTDVQNVCMDIESTKIVKYEISDNPASLNAVEEFADSQRFLEAVATVDKLKTQDATETLLSSLNSIEELDTDSFETEDFLRLSNCEPLDQCNTDTFDGLSYDESTSSKVSSLKFSCCLQSDITERVSQLKLSLFNNSQYLFIQHQTWIQVWRKEEYCDWVKIFAHQVEGLQFQELCLTQSKNYLVLIMLLISDKRNHCLQFLVFERESRLIKLMEHTHWFENSSKDEDRVFLCDLDELRFATAEGRNIFKVHSHSFSCLEDSPRLLTVMLGSTSDSLHSLCRIDKLPNALLGMSTNMLYVWHHLEARLVNSVELQVADSLDIQNCSWATIENGLVFLLAVCEEKEISKACYLLAANLATGFCEIVLTFTLQPSLDIAEVPKSKQTDLAYSEPFIVAACEEGAFLWTVDDEYCCASLKALDYSSVAIVPSLKNSFSIVVGCNGGCVNCYELKCY